MTYLLANDWLIDFDWQVVFELTVAIGRYLTTRSLQFKFTSRAYRYTWSHSKDDDMMHTPMQRIPPKRWVSRLWQPYHFCVCSKYSKFWLCGWLRHLRSTCCVMRMGKMPSFTLHVLWHTQGSVQFTIWLCKDLCSCVDYQIGFLASRRLQARPPDSTKF